jgi:phosphatidylserine synthase
LAFTNTLSAIVTAPSENVTVPVFTGIPLLVTVAVNVTKLPKQAGFKLVVTTVVVISAATLFLAFAWRSLSPTVRFLLLNPLNCYLLKSRDLTHMHLPAEKQKIK